MNNSRFLDVPDAQISPRLSLHGGVGQRRIGRILQPSTALVLVLLAHLYSPIFSQNAATPVPTLEPNTPTNHVVKGTERNEFRIEVAGDQYLRISVTQNGIPLYVSLSAPDGKQIVKVDNSTGKLERLVFSALTTQAGTYGLVVESTGTLALGDFTVVIEEQRAATPDDKQRVAIERTLLEAERLRAQSSTDSSVKAIQAYEATLPFWRRMSSRPEEGYVLTALGRLHSTIDQKELALSYFSQALALWQKSGDVSQTASTLNDLGLIHSRLNQKLKALDYFQEALAMSRTLGDRSREAYVLENLGQTFASFSDTTKALDQYNQALNIWRTTGNREGEAIMVQVTSIQQIQSK